MRTPRHTPPAVTPRLSLGLFSLVCAIFNSAWGLWHILNPPENPVPAPDLSNVAELGHNLQLACGSIALLILGLITGCIAVIRDYPQAKLPAIALLLNVAAIGLWAAADAWMASP